MTETEIAFAIAGLALGGFLKGATGAGAPVVGVPVLAVIFDVPMAVAIFSVLNLITNIWHAWAYRIHRAQINFVWIFALMGGIGAAAGSVLLATLPTEALMGGLAGIVFIYIALRLARPNWVLDRTRGARLAPIAGAVGGVMQGAGGISAPVSITYLNAMRLTRSEFIATISVFFMVMSLFQVPSLALLGVITWERLQMTALAAIPLFAAIPLGELAGRRVSKTVFDRAILILLALIGVRLIWAALT
ncbi:MAG: sulfite exporter TauE/SafE family protein [Pseudomonadota bacterium]